MDENEFLTFDRIQKIQSVVGKYGEENFCISWSGGKDSQVMSKLFDLAIPDNKIPRVYADTGLDLKIMRDFVNEQKAKDDRIVIIKPSVPVKPMLEKEGYPFKSKKHAGIVDVYQRLGWRDPVLRYIGKHPSGKNWTGSNHCPDILLYQFSEDFELRVSDKCCLRMKEEPLKKWAKENGKPYHVIGVMRSEGGAKKQCGMHEISWR